MLKQSLCDYNDAYVLVKGSVFSSTAAVDVNANNKNKTLAFKNYLSFTDCISGVNSQKEDNAKDLDVVMAVIIIKKKIQDAYFNIKEINQFYVIIVILFIFVLVILLVNLNSKQK